MLLQDSTRKTTNRLSCSIFRDTFRVSIAVVRIFSMKFRPLHDRVLVRPVEQEEKTAGGIIIPDTAKEKPMEGKVGDRVLFGKWSGTEIKLDGDEFMIMKESDLMGIIEGNVGSKRKAA